MEGVPLWSVGVNDRVTVWTSGRSISVQDPGLKLVGEIRDDGIRKLESQGT